MDWHTGRELVPVRTAPPGQGVFLALHFRAANKRSVQTDAWIQTHLARRAPGAVTFPPRLRPVEPATVGGRSCVQSFRRTSTFLRPLAPCPLRHFFATMVALTPVRRLFGPIEGP